MAIHPKNGINIEGYLTYLQQGEHTVTEYGHSTTSNETKAVMTRNYEI